MKFTLRSKLLLIMISLLMVVTIVASIISSANLNSYFKEELSSNIRTQLGELQIILPELELADPLPPLQYQVLTNYARAAGRRITLIDSAGVVIFDSEVPAKNLAALENHWLRPEIQASISQEYGQNERLSSTTRQHLYYVARRVAFTTAQSPFLHRAHFLRVAVPLENIRAASGEIRNTVLLAGTLAVSLIGLLSFGLLTRFTAPISSLANSAKSVQMGNLSAHFERQTDDEIGDLAELLNEMLGKLRNDLIEMDKLQQMRSQFLANVSHELRTPIFTLQGYLETLMKVDIPDPKKRKKFIRKAYKSAQRLNLLLTDLIDISRIESGEMEMRFQYFELHPWLDSQVSDLKQEAEKEKISVRLQPQYGNGSLAVLGDKKRLTQVLTNLVQNAIKYNLPNGTVTVSYAPANGHVTISVADSGRGISPVHIPRLFERFYRVDTERSRSVGGTGLGLAIVKHIIDAHGSRVRVESQPGKGSTFSFSLKTGQEHEIT